MYHIFVRRDLRRNSKVTSDIGLRSPGEVNCPTRSISQTNVDAFPGDKLSVEPP